MIFSAGEAVFKELKKKLRKRMDFERVWHNVCDTTEDNKISKKKKVNFAAYVLVSQRNERNWWLLVCQIVVWVGVGLLVVVHRITFQVFFLRYFIVFREIFFLFVFREIFFFWDVYCFSRDFFFWDVYYFSRDFFFFWDIYCFSRDFFFFLFFARFFFLNIVEYLLIIIIRTFWSQLIVIVLCLKWWPENFLAFR